MFNDIFGDPSEERLNEKYAKDTPEMKTEKSYETFQHISRLLTFPQSFDPIFQKIYEMMEKCNKKKDINKLEEILNNIAIGISHNGSVMPPDLLIFIHNIMKKLPKIAKTLKKELKQKELSNNKKAKFEQVEKDLKVKTKVEKSISYFQANESILKQFALQLLHKNLKQKTIDLNDLQILGMLDPFVPILGESLSSRSMQVSKFALKVFYSSQITSAHPFSPFIS